MIESAIKERLVAALGAEYVLDSNESKLVYSYDATPGMQAMPDVIVFPGSTEDVQRIVKICQETGTPIVARGSGTNLSGGTCPLEGGVVITFQRMNHILELDEENLTLTVQPGVITQDMIKYVEKNGLFYPPDPSSMKISTIGGNIAENSGGLRGLKYGVTRDYVLGLTAVLANGEVIRTGGKLAKDVAGYDMTRLLVGSEGTLAVITEAILKLIPMPETKKTLLAVYEDMDQAAQSVSAIIAHKIIPTTLEFLDQATIKVVEAFAHVGLPTEAGAVLLIEQDGAPEVVDRDIEKMAKLCQELGASSVEKANSEEEADALRSARRAALSACARLKPTTILEDATVPRSKVAEMVRAINEITEKYGLEVCTFGHAGDGNLHPTFLTDARNTEEMARVEQAFGEIFAKAIALGGTITGEHGVGAMKAPYLEWKVGKAGIGAMRAIKTALDPHNLLNPGKLFSESAEGVFS
ncbi:glycolate oxidase [Pullulanibacillus pueri]|uniref:Glycolate oxidase subunit GlcD n=1 Tax=Pullulanibacillus pueri TaxID=1437324 RepID=A0A8J3EKS2_9BACL|nr:glycolate oxidase subunit GlcD [Pullulanibacillus pueri]MBM7681837.1 glycolate oxidase [Pullulanibacillus pueri]GGH76284.1 glycolate oxidase subunit GlcD [Pullulanibacillus pueri]